MEQGELSSVKESLSDSYSDVYDDEGLRQQLESQGESVSAGYSDAFEDEDAYGSMESAAEDASLGTKYSRTFQNNMSVRDDASEEGEDAFDDGARSSLAEAAQQANISELYRLCGSGNMSEVQDRLGVDDSPDNAGECQSLVSYAKGLATQYFKGYAEEGETHSIPQEMKEKFGISA